LFDNHYFDIISEVVKIDYNYNQPFTWTKKFFFKKNFPPSPGLAWLRLAWPGLAWLKNG
jgi:hypothetical protein